MSTQINYYNQNNVSTRFNPFIQNAFNSKREINNYNKINNNMNNAKTISTKNNLDNPNGNIYNQTDDISNNIKYVNKVFMPSPPILTIEETYKILNQINTCVCKIYKSDDVYATGFFCEIPFANSKLKVLITNNHVLNKDDIKVNRIIKIIVNEKEKKIIINEPRITFTNEKLEVTIIEIIPKVDGINDFLEIS